MNNKSPEVTKMLDEISLSVFGRSRTLAQAGSGCVACGQPATEFRDELSRKEYLISGFCQKCQDATFGAAFDGFAD
jgi:hypothetical protein